MAVIASYSPMPPRATIRRRVRAVGSNTSRIACVGHLDCHTGKPSGHNDAEEEDKDHEDGDGDLDDDDGGDEDEGIQACPTVDSQASLRPQVILSLEDLCHGLRKQVVVVEASFDPNCFHKERQNTYVAEEGAGGKDNSAVDARVSVAFNGGVTPLAGEGRREPVLLDCPDGGLDSRSDESFMRAIIAEQTINQILKKRFLNNSPGPVAAQPAEKKNTLCPCQRVVNPSHPVSPECQISSESMVHPPVSSQLKDRMRDRADIKDLEEKETEQKFIWSLILTQIDDEH
ncbi:hypothetical protein F5877DRAFT_65758 [Lentinula edodes]|nr:hypothetical protein F5877DRAFT_65758 [Lentinula edodes]